MTSGVFPKTDGEVFYAQDANLSYYTANNFGDGSDGIFLQTTGTINLTQGVVYQYSSFTLGQDATLSASSTSLAPMIIKVQGDCTINGTIDLKGKGCAKNIGYETPQTTYAGSGGAIAHIRCFGSAGKININSYNYCKCSYKGGNLYNFYNNIRGSIMNGTGGANSDYVGGVSTSLGGPGGSSASTDGALGENGSDTGSTLGEGGNGGCTLLMIVGGNLTFGASSVIDVSGSPGSNGSRAGGGGGGSGDILIFYRGLLTDNGVTKIKSGGAGGLDTTNGDADGGNGANGQEKIVPYDTILW